VLLARRSGLHVARIDHLLGRFGGMVDEILDLVEDRRVLGLPLEGAEDYLAAEVVYAVTHEGARHLDDVLTRRTRVSIETFDRGVAAAPGVARLMGAELGWDEARQADEARVKAPDIV
jgi:glycerol-3-phosphate dehydrogenase